MNEFKATFSRMRSAAQDEASLSRELKSLENDINRILNTLSVRSSEAVQIRRALRNNMQNVSDARKKLDIMSSALTDIVRLYQSAENRIAGSDTGNKTAADLIRDGIQDAMDKIRDIANKWGMNASTAYSKDPVNLSNGNYVYEKVCMELDTEMAMNFRIFYNIQNETAGSLGRGWIHTWEVSLERSEGRISMIQDDASRLIFLEADGSYQPAPGTAATFRRQEEWDIVTDKNGIAYYFNASGHLVRMENLSGCSITLEYDEEEHLTQVQDRRGNFFRLAYDGKGMLETVTDHVGREVKFLWNNDQLSAVIDPEGRKTAYHYDAHGWLTELVNGRGITCLVNTYDSQGRTVSQKFPDGGRMDYRYLDEERQVVVTEQNGNEITYEHDEYLRNTRTIYADGEEVNTYDGNNNRISSTDKRGNTSYYAYDTSGNLVSFRNAMEDELEFTYNHKNQITQVLLNGSLIQRAQYNDRNLQVETENANGTIDRYEYDQYGQPVMWEKPDGSRVELTYDSKGNLTAITNAAGGCTHYQYNDRNQVVKTIDPLGNETCYEYNDADELILVRDSAGNTQTYTYDACGNVIRMTGLDGGETVTEYNEMNRPVRVTEPDGSETVYEYDTMWNVTSVTAPDGGKTTCQYDKLHRLIAVTDPEGGTNRMEYDACGNLIQRVDPDGGIHKLSYDPLNRPDYVCDPMGMEVRAQYDALGNVTDVVYSDGSAEHYEYDRMGNLLSSQDQSGYQKFYEYDILGNLQSVSDSVGVLEEYCYYPGGLLETEHYADGSSRTFYYDKNENVVRIVNQDGGQWQFTYDCLGRVVQAFQDGGMTESYEYDALGNITAVIDGNGVRTAYQYQGNQITAVRDGLGQETYFSYDRCRRLARVVQAGRESIDPGQINAFNREQKDLRIIDYHYDRKGNIIESVDPEGNRTLYTYDGNNRILSQTDGEGNVTSCEYHPDGTVKAWHFADGKAVKLSYNPLKQLVQMEDWLGITRITPDSLGRPQQVTTPEDETVSYEWGPRGERKAMVYPDGLRVSYEYDQAMGLTRCQMGEETVSYGYAPGGRLKERILSDNRKTLYQYNPAGYISEICHMKGDEVIDRLTYQYDRNCRKTRITRTRAGMEDNGMYEYRYNGVGSLVSVWRDGKEEEIYDYDGYGNRIFSRVRGSETSYAYNRLDQLVRMNDQEGEHAYSYDIRGNLLLEQVNGITARSMQFNAQGLLEQVKRAGKTVCYQYNGFGDRVGRTVTGDGAGLSTSSYLYDITKPYNHLLGVREESGNRNLIWDGGILASTDAGDIQYFFNDERMSPMRIMQGDSILGSRSFDSFGNPLEEIGNGKNIFGYAGYRPDPVSGFVHVNAREYDTRSGRFISRDLIPGMIVLPLTLNAYTYALGDPVNRLDPTGMVVAWLAGGIVGAVTKVVSKVAGDVVESVATGKIHVSSWQSYVGAATGGFTYGATYVVTPGSGKVKKMVAGAASGAVETFTTEGLSMLTGAPGYRKEDGYSWKNLAVNTVKGGVTGAGSSYLFDSVKIKIPGITSGQGSCQAVWKQVMTKASKGLIGDISWKTIGKGIVAYGGVHLLSELYAKGKKKVEDIAKNKGINLVPTMLTNILSGNRGSAQCVAEG
ncbi:MAG: hypothetical protein HFG62_01000 [Lachnospiraceae bacterium]|nr:hypothetical protein [Lachnospiraceae bacterium]